MNGDGPAEGSAHVPSDDLAMLREALATAERRAATLAELTALMSEAHNPLALAQRAVELTAKATRAAGAYVYLWDRDDERLVLRAATEGYQRPHVGSIRLRMGEGVTGWSALMRQTVVVPSDPTKDPRFKSFPELRESAFRSMIAVPVVAPGEEVLGVFSLYARVEDAFRPADVNLASEVGSLLANGLVQAETLTQLQVQSTAARFLYDVPDDAWGSLENCLQAMAAQCAADLDADVCVLEVTTDRTTPHGSVHAFAATHEFEERHPEIVQASERNRAGLMQLLAELDLPRLRIPLAAASPIGAVTCYRVRRFAQEDEHLLEAIGAQIAAGSLSILGAQKMRPALEQLVTSPNAEATQTTLLRLGWKRRTTSVAIVRVRVLAGSGRAWDGEQLRSALSSSIGDENRRLVVLGDAGSFVVLVETADPSARETFVRAIQAVSEQPGIRLAAGVGPLSPSLRDVHRSISGALVATHWAELAAVTTDSVVPYERVAHLRLLPQAALGMSDGLHALLGLLGAVVEYDLANGTDLAQTLEALLANSGSVAKAAGELYIHRNTLRQRIQRIEELIGQSPETFDDWITAGLAARLVRQSEDDLSSSPDGKNSVPCPNGVLTVGRACCGMPQNCPIIAG